MTAPDDLHEWLSFDLDDDTYDVRRHVPHQPLDAASSARGCPGVLTGPAPELEQGCCSYGAHFTDKADRKRVAGAAPSGSTPTSGSSRPRPTTPGGPIHKNEDGEWVTRLRRRRLHLPQPARLRRRRRVRAAPGRARRAASASSTGSPRSAGSCRCASSTSIDDNEHVTYTLREWKRRDWGEGGAEFHWWCTDDPEAFVGHRARVRGAARRDRRAGRREALRARSSSSVAATRPPSSFLPHPAAQEAAPRAADRHRRHACVHRRRAPAGLARGRA